MEITEHGVHIVSGDRSVELPVDRDATGALDAASAEALRGALQRVANPDTRAQAFCLLPARGVSVRRIALPASSAQEIERLLPLQIDAQFPLSSEELAWGYTPLGASVPSRDGPPLKELLVAAVKKDAVQQYREIFAGSGFTPLFVVAALARQALCAHAPRKFGVLEVGKSRSELLTLDESGPATLRVITLGADGYSSAEPLMAALRNNGAVEKIYVGGKSAAAWSARIAPSIPSEALPVAAGDSSAIAGLRETLRRGHEPLLIQAHREAPRALPRPAAWKWAATAGVLLVLSVALRYAEPAMRRAEVTRAMGESRAALDKLPKIDRELSFLQYIKTNQPTYLEAVATLATASPPGTRFDSISMTRRGEVSLRGVTQSGQQVGALRSKMIESGFFANVVLDEQTPGQNQQMSFRMTATLRPEGDRTPPPKAESEKPAPAAAKPAATNAPKPKAESKP